VRRNNASAPLLVGERSGFTRAVGMSEVFILGAGFSKAISDAMPVTNALTALIQKQLEDEHVSVPSSVLLDFGVDLEGWLSFLATDQPWLDRQENLRNQALFLDASRILGEALWQRQNGALADPMPEWLGRLVMHWHRTRATVVTFNYDNLVEKAASEALRSVETSFFHTALRPVPIPSAMSRHGGVVGAGEVETFSLVKLHGSLDWIYSGSPDFYGEMIFSVNLANSWSPDTPTPASVAFDKQRLIVPPTSGKNVFMNHETIRAQWRFARQQIERAKKIHLIGYSLPATDMMARTMLTVSSGPPQQKGELVVVNPDESIMQRLTGVTYRPPHYWADLHRWLDELVEAEEAAQEMPTDGGTG
jgi:hypothetical protein